MENLKIGKQTEFQHNGVIVNITIGYDLPYMSTIITLNKTEMFYGQLAQLLKKIENIPLLQGLQLLIQKHILKQQVAQDVYKQSVYDYVDTVNEEITKFIKNYIEKQ